MFPYRNRYDRYHWNEKPLRRNVVAANSVARTVSGAVTETSAE